MIRLQAPADTHCQSALFVTVRKLCGVLWKAHCCEPLSGAVGEKVLGFGDAAIDKIVAAIRDPLTLDAAKAEWIANQLLEAGEHGILLPVNVVLDAYVRGKSR